MRWIVLVPLLLAGVARGATAQTKVIVPAVKNSSCAAAKAAIEAAGLVFQILPPGDVARGTCAASDTGLVADQDPPGNTHADPGSVVSVVLVVPPQPDNLLRLGIIVIIVILGGIVVILIRRP